MSSLSNQTPPNGDPSQGNSQAEDTRSMGVTMLVIFWLGVFALGTYFANGWLNKRENPNQQAQSYGDAHMQQITLKRNVNGHYVANGRINGQPVEFFLDTGATLVSVPKSVADRLGLKKLYNMRSSTANGTINTYGTTLDLVELSGLKVEDVQGSINPYMEGEQILLGMSFLKHMEWSQRNGELILRQHRP